MPEEKPKTNARERAFPSAAISDDHGGMTLAEYYAGQVVGILALGMANDPTKTDQDLVITAANLGVALACEMASRRDALKAIPPS